MSDFVYERRVAFSDTDAMGVVHHANYLRFCEEARVAWMRARGLSETHYPHTEKVLAVLNYRVWHLHPATFEDVLRIRVQVRRDRLKIQFQYAIYKDDERIAEAETVHVPLDGDLRPVRPDPRLIHVLENEAWIETWLSSL
jgi:acyl-CoA thioester hydrolase